MKAQDVGISVSKGEIAFFEQGGIIYCRDTKNEDIVICGTSITKKMEDISRAHKAMKAGMVD